MSTEAWVVLWPVGDDGDMDTATAYGPFGSEDECYTFAAKVSVEPNDWRPLQVRDTESA